MPLSVSLRHLRCFLAVADCGSFTGASERLFLTQSSLTAAIQQLEEAVGLRLFDRTTRSVELTREAQLFRPQAERIMRDFDGAITDLRSIAQSRSGEIRIAAPQSVIEIFLAEAIVQFQASFPGIRFTLREHGAERSEELVAQGEVDFALGEKFKGYNDLSYEPLLKDRMGAISRRPLPVRRKAGGLQWAELPESNYVSFTANTGIAAFMAAHAPADVARRAVDNPVQVSSTIALFSLLQASDTYAIIPALPAVIGQRLGLNFQPLVAPVLSRQINLISRRLRTLSPTSGRLLQTLHAVIDGKTLSIGVSKVARTAQPKA